MYERFYNLRERPFALSPDPEYLYLGRVHREALDSLRYGIESRAGFIVITGDIGAGKTTLLQTVLRRLDERTVVARLVNTTLDPRELLESIMLEFGLDTAGKSKPALLRDLGQFLVRQRAEGRRPLLVIDEAQNLSVPALEEIRLLSNLETEKSKLLQILLAGQPNLRDAIASSELEQFRQRVAVSYHLTPLDAQETAAYINSRLEHAAIGVPPRFPADAAELVHKRSGGVPRIINVICDAALVFGYAEERHQIDLPLIRDVVGELELTGVLRPLPAAVPAPVEAGHGPADLSAVAASGATAGVRTPTAAPVVAPAAAPVAAHPAASVGVQPAASVGAQPAASVGFQPAASFGAKPAAAGGPQAAAPVAAQPAASIRVVERPAVSGSDLNEAALARAAQEAAARASALAGREQALKQRERELAEQRRVLAEEYRLLRSRQASAAASTPAGRMARPSADTRYAAPRAEGFRAWLRRLFTGGSARSVAATRSLHGS